MENVVCLCPDLYEIGGWWWKKILGIVGPPRCSDAFAVVTRLLVVPRHHPFGGCEGHKTCARAQQRIERLGGPIQMLVNEYQYFGCWGGQQEPIHRDMNKSADFVCFVKE